jgi:hypothetical protein
MQSDLQLNIPQQIFTLFYAITWGTAANSQPRWRAFAWGAISMDRPTRRRAFLSSVVLNVLPLIYFAIVLFCLSSGGWANVSQWKFEAFLKILVSTIPALAPFGFYRMWIGCVECSREYFYGVPKDWKPSERPPFWDKVGLDLKESDLNPDFAPGKFLWGAIYVFVGLVAALAVKCL